MDVQIDLRVTELLASRLCHDLVGPVGAVNNGLELLADEIDDMGPEALKLASDSAARAARALQYFRFAYGMAGSRVGGNLDELRQGNLDALHGAVAVEPGAPEVSEGVRAASPLGDAEIAAPVLVGEGVEIGEGVRLEGPAIVSDGCRIGDGAIVRDSILLAGTELPAESILIGGIAAHGTKP